MQEANVGPQTEFHDSEDSLSTWALASDADDDRTFLAPSGALIAIPTYYWSTTPQPTQLFQITPVLNTGLSLSEPLQLYKGYNAI